MEVRCGSCAKLFRVSDDKITGTGIKFTCSRCGEYVKITKEDFEHYILSQTAVSALDLFEPKPKTTKAPLQTSAVEAEVSATAGTADSTGLDLSTSPVSHEESSTVLSEPASDGEFATPATEAVAEPALPEPGLFSEAEPVAASKPASSAGQVPPPVAEPKPAPAPQPVQRPAPVPVAASQLEAKPGTILPKSGVTAASEPKPASVRPAASAAPRSVSTVQSKSPKMEAHGTALSAEQQTTKARVKETLPAPSRSGRTLLYAVIVLVVFALAGYGAFTFFRSEPKKEQVATPVMVSTEGLHIVNPAGSPDANGDLLITGMVENSLDTARPAWYVVIDVYNAQGVVLDKVRFLNGKQLYTRRDYDILAKRGTNIQDLKANTRQEQGVVIPPKGSVTFEIRYVQPPAGVASFNATLQPFDPIRLYKEIASENK